MQEILDHPPFYQISPGGPHSFVIAEIETERAFERWIVDHVHQLRAYLPSPVLSVQVGLTGLSGLPAEHPVRLSWMSGRLVGDYPHNLRPQHHVHAFA